MNGNQRGVVSDTDAPTHNVASEEHDDRQNDREDPGESNDSAGLAENNQSRSQHSQLSRGGLPQGGYDGSFPPPGHHGFANSVSYPGIPPQILPAPPQPGPHMLQFYESQMRDHAAAYASAAAGAAWAAAQIAADMANASSTTGGGALPSNAATGNPHAHLPRALPVPPAVFPTLMGHPYAVQHPPYAPHPGFPVMDPNMLVPGYPPQAPGPLDGPYTHGENQISYPQTEHNGQRRRKRQQRMPPSETGHSQPSQGSGGVSQRKGRKWRTRPDGPNDTSYNQALQSNTSNRRARIRKTMNSSNSSDGGSTGGPTQFSKKKKARQLNDESLLGKTGVSALYEWCSKRRTTPTFTIQPQDVDESNKSTDQECISEDDERRRRQPVLQFDFEMAVSIDGVEWGRGRGRTKAAAKQEAARRSLEALLPGIVFEETSGILVHLPNCSNKRSGRHQTNLPHEAPWKASTSLEDLAPNLAKRLAIAPDREEDNPRTMTNSMPSKKRPSKWNNMYPETSTTSEEEDQNAYYASRGASVCSALLHTMVQIDDRIPEAPNYAYDVATVSSDGEIVDSEDIRKAKSKVGATTSKPGSIDTGRALPVHRGPFTCTASIRVKRTPSGEKSETPTKMYDLLQAVSTAGTKREARHTASAKLLAKLFPECDGMAQVKEAAEEARERYAASKAQKQQSRRDRGFFTNNGSWNPAFQQPNELLFAKPSQGTPPLPKSVQSRFLSILQVKEMPNNTQSNDDSRASLQLSRQRQLDDWITSSLQKLNDHDDEGRSLPDELTADDVGRTLLRQAGPEDLPWIFKLLDETGISWKSPASILRYGDDSCNELEIFSAASGLPLWTGSAVVLLLCRAIAPFDDPPLGCAVLTLGFSMERGRTLCLSQIGSQPHLPRERFIECLQNFVSCMGCAFEGTSMAPGKNAPNSMVVLRGGDMTNIVEAHLPSAHGQLGSISKPNTEGPIRVEQPKTSLDPLTLTSPLQSVREESEEVEESGAESSPEKRISRKEQDKPSKRSRVN